MRDVRTALAVSALVVLAVGCKKPAPKGGTEARPQGASGLARPPGAQRSDPKVAALGERRVAGPASDLRTSPDAQVLTALFNGERPAGQGVPPPMKVGDLWALRATTGKSVKVAAGVVNTPGGWLFSDDSRYLLAQGSYQLKTLSGELWLMDLSAMEGAPQKLGDDVSYFVASFDSKLLAFVQGGVLKVGPLPAGPFKDLAGEVATAAFSRDAQTIYFRRKVVAAGGLFQVALKDAGKAPKKLTDQVGDFEVTPDGTHVVYLARSSVGARSYQLFVADAASLKSVKVAEDVFRFTLSFDGKWLSRLQGDNPGEPGDLWLGDISGEPGTKLGARVNEMVFSPDSTRFAWRQNFHEIKLLGQQVEKVGELVVRQLATGKQKSFDKQCPNFSFSPDSKTLAYTATVFKPLYSRDLFVWRDGDEQPTKLQEWLYEYIFTPASDRLYFRAECLREGRSCWLWSVDLKEKVLAAKKEADSTFSFKLSQDGKRVLYVSAHVWDEQFDVYLYDPSTRKKHALEGSAKVPVYFVAPDGSRVGYMVEEKARNGIHVASAPP